MSYLIWATMVYIVCLVFVQGATIAESYLGGLFALLGSGGTWLVANVLLFKGLVAAGIFNGIVVTS